MSGIFSTNKNWNYLLLLACLIIIIITGYTVFDQKSGFNKAKGCQDIGILLPATGQEAGRWEQEDRHHLVGKIIKNIQGSTIRYFNANSDAKLQEEQANLALEKGSCILIISPVNSKQAINIVKKAKSKRVPVIAYDRFIDDDDLSFYVSYNSKKVGELQANYVIEELKKGENGLYKLKQGDKLVMINGDINDGNTKLIKEGWFELLESHFDDEKLSLVFPKTKDNPEYFINKWDGKLAAKKVEELLTKDKDIKIILVANDGMANEIIGILGEKKGKILITGQDGSQQSKKNIGEKSQAITISKPVEPMAKETVKIIKALSKGDDINILINNTDIKTSNGKNIPTYLRDPISVTIENVND